MALLMESWIAELVVVVSTGVLALYLWFSSAYKYWKNRGVPYVEPTFPFGNFRRTILGQDAIAVSLQKIYNHLPSERYVGFYGFLRPLLLIRDPDIIRNILIKDFNTFHDRGLFFNDKEPLNHHLVALGGKKWRQLRVKMTPTFTSGKLKGMFTTIQECGKEMADVVGEMVERGDSVELGELTARYTNDVISSVGFGIVYNSQREPDNHMRQWGRISFAPTAAGAISLLLSIISPTLVRLLRIEDGVSAISKPFQRMIADTVAYREKNNYRRKDFMDLLIQLKNKGYVDVDKGETSEDEQQKAIVTTDKLSMEDLAAQAFAFFIAGFETSSSTSSFALHELAFNPDVQRKLQDEIDTTLKENGGEITYDTIAKMTYLDKVVAETLRKYPPITFLMRECNKSYKFPNSDLVLEKGTPVMISLVGLHRDPKHYPDPERFDPERFSEEAKAQRHQYAYLPFGEGPRICIGMRLGLLQTKVGLVNLLSKFSVRPTGKTPANLGVHGRSLFLTSESGIHVRFEKRF